MFTKNLRILFAAIIILFWGCQSGQDSKATNSEPSNFHKVIVQEVLQASEYTYLRAKENNNELWLAVPSMQAKTGDTYYYEGGVEMKKFESKDLHKVFESIILLERLNTEPKTTIVATTDKPNTNTSSNNSSTTNQDGASASSEGYKRKATPPEKKEIKLEAAKGGITIAKLFSEKESLSGKTVKIKGEVTKYTPAVMKKNWIHIQDGTDFKGNFDLVVTSDLEVKVGDVVTLEGKISLNKDLGYGYFFEVIMEDAVIK